MNGTSLTDIANSIIAELKEEGIEPTLENITDRLNKYIDLSEGERYKNCGANMRGEKE